MRLQCYRIGRLLSPLLPVSAALGLRRWLLAGASDDLEATTLTADDSGQV